MDRQQAIDALNDASQNMDIEIAHMQADEILCELLRDLGYIDVVDAWEAVEKWYA